MVSQMICPAYNLSTATSNIAKAFATSESSNYLKSKERQNTSTSDALAEQWSVKRRGTDTIFAFVTYWRLYRDWYTLVWSTAGVAVKPNTWTFQSPVWIISKTLAQADMGARLILKL
eukprot:TRINITY_DN40903_c0_g1_i1.p3 TRINITY_DN40903_c0_g1~~TRINITY_DN40903_c0_g1_i1.p3  ORF type:complete len:117 (+),score=15.09 TRINITY_DN40903_c0_g1_i1:93-443(+)